MQSDAIHGVWLVLDGLHCWESFQINLLVAVTESSTRGIFAPWECSFKVKSLALEHYMAFSFLPEE